MATTFDPLEKLMSDNFFYLNEVEIKKHLGIGEHEQVHTNSDLDIQYGIDFIYGHRLIAYKTIYQKFETFTFRIPPSGAPELFKLQRTNEALPATSRRLRVNPPYKLIVVVANEPLGMLFWANFDEIDKLPDKKFHEKPVPSRNDGTKMHVAWHDDIEAAGGVINSVRVDWAIPNRD